MAASLTVAIFAALLSAEITAAPLDAQLLNEVFVDASSGDSITTDIELTSMSTESSTEGTEISVTEESPSIATDLVPPADTEIRMIVEEELVAPDLDVAETLVFRPLFAYRKSQARPQRLRKNSNRRRYFTKVYSQPQHPCPYWGYYGNTV